MPQGKAAVSSPIQIASSRAESCNWKVIMIERPDTFMERWNHPVRIILVIAFVIIVISWVAYIDSKIVTIFKILFGVDIFLLAYWLIPERKKKESK